VAVRQHPLPIPQREPLPPDAAEAAAATHITWLNLTCVRLVLLFSAGRTRQFPLPMRYSFRVKQGAQMKAPQGVHDLRQNLLPKRNPHTSIGQPPERNYDETNELEVSLSE